MFSQWMQNLGQSIAKTFGESQSSGLEAENLSFAQLNHFFRLHHLQDVLCYRSYDPTTQLFQNEDGIGFVMECAPLVGCTQAMQRETS